MLFSFLFSGRTDYAQKIIGNQFEQFSLRAPQIYAVVRYLAGGIWIIEAHAAPQKLLYDCNRWRGNPAQQAANSINN